MNAAPITDIDDKTLFLSVDLAKATSVLLAFPLIVDKGNLGLVPQHFRGYNRNPRDVIQQIRRFRNMRRYHQESYTREWKAMKNKEKNAYRDNIKWLMDLKNKIILGQTEWNDIATEPLNCDGALVAAERATKKKRKAPPLEDISNRRNTRSYGGFRGPTTSTSSTVVPDPVMTDTPPVMPATMHAARVTPPLPPLLGATPLTLPDILPTLPNVPPPPPPMTQEAPSTGMAVRAHRATAGDNNEYVGLGSSKEARYEVARVAKNRARQDTKRKVGVGTLKTCQRSDAVSNRVVETCMRAGALAADTIRPIATGAANYSLARRTIIVLDINECQDSHMDGGRIMKDSKCCRPKPRVTVVGAKHIDELEFAIGTLTQAFKHFGNASKQKYDVEFVGEGGSDSNVTAVEKLLEKRKAVRKHVPKKPRQASDVIREQHEEE